MPDKSSDFPTCAPPLRPIKVCPCKAYGKTEHAWWPQGFDYCIALNASKIVVDARWGELVNLWRSCCDQFKLSVLTGVLLLNACLTVRAHSANSHKDQGWEQLTDAVVKYISDNSRGVVFLLWGSYAQKKAAAVDKVLLLPC
jgi:hypothetical protein